MARKSRKNIPEVVSSATVQTEVSRPFRAGLYARISMETEETLERGTIETQVELMKNFVADTEDISVAEVYKDSDYSGTNFDRPGFVQMMEDIKHGKINCVIVKDLSRLGRNYVETSNYIERVFPFFHVHLPLSGLQDIYHGIVQKQERQTFQEAPGGAILALTM